MRLYKKLILLTLALFSALSVYANAAVFTDVKDDEEYYDAINTLSLLEIVNGYSDNTFRPWSTITRAEFTTIVVRALSLDDVQVSSADTLFSDISNNYAKYNIKTAYDLGIINGFEDGTFRPDDTIIYEQMIKMVVCTLGYGSDAEQAGGYPYGYISVANQLGLPRNINVEFKDPAPRGAIAQLMYNALNVKLKQPVVGGYKITDDTIMNSRLNVNKMKIYITGVEDKYIETGFENLQKGEISVTNMSDGNSFIMNYSKAVSTADEMKKYLGQILTVYYREDKNDPYEIPDIIIIDEVSNINKIIEITSKDIVDYKDNTLYYNEDGKGRTRTIKIQPSDISFIYNGKAVNSGSTINGISISDQLYAWLNPDEDEFLTGDVKIIDSEGDNSADVVFITNYDVMVASSSVSSTDYKITDKLVSGNNLILDPSDDNYTFSVIRNGNKAEITSIKTNDIILIAKSLDDETYTLNVTASPVTGSITEISDDEIYIDGKLYYMTDECLNYIDNQKNIKVGAQGTFYIDNYNDIIFCTIEKGSAATYAYLLNIIDDTDSGYYQANIYVPSISKTSVQRLNLKDKVVFNGSSISSDSVADRLERTSSLSRADIDNKENVYTNKNNQPSANDIAQIVKVNISNNQITNITTMESDKLSENEDEDLIIRYKELDKYKYSSSNNFNDEFYINSSTKIIYVPGTRSSKTDYAQYTASSIFKTGESYWVEPYDVNDKKVASLVIMYGNSSLAEITKDTLISVITKTPTLTSLNGDNVNKLTMYFSTSTLVTKNSEDDREFSDVEVGDIIQFGYNNNNQITNRNNIIFAKDVLDVLNNDETFSWNDEKFNYYYTENGSIIYDSATDKPYSRVFIANVSQVINDDDETYIRITQDGFDGDVLNTDNALRYEVENKTPVVKFNTSKNTVSAYIDGTTTKLNVTDLKDAENNGTSCSKIMVFLLRDKVKFIMMYE